MNPGVWITLGVVLLFVAFAVWLERPYDPPLDRCPVCGSPDRNCQGRMTSACLPSPPDSQSKENQ